MNSDAATQPHEPGWYEIRLEGRIDPRWSPWLDGLRITGDTEGTTVLHGPVADQSALHGLLARLRDIGLPLISITRVEPGRNKHEEHDTIRRDNPIGD